MKHPRTTIALATAGALTLAAVPVIAQEVAADPDAATATESPGDASESPSDASDRAERAPDTRTRAHRTRPGPGGFGPMVDQLSDDFAAELADELGLSAEEVEDAIDRIRERWTEDFEATLEEHRQEAQDRMAEHLDQAVEDGALTPEQADALSDLFAGGEGFGPGRFPELTDDQRDALDALREWAGEQLGEEGWGGGLRHGPGGPKGWFGGERSGPDDRSTDDGADEEATESGADPFTEDGAAATESSLQTT